MASTLVLGQQGWRESIGDRSKLETAATSEMDDCFHNYLAKIKVRTIENLSCPKWKKNLSNILERPSLSIAKKSLSCRPGMGVWPVADRRPCGFIFFQFFIHLFNMFMFMYIYIYICIHIYIMHCVLYGCYVDHHLYMDGVEWGGVGWSNNVTCITCSTDCARYGCCAVTTSPRYGCYAVTTSARYRCYTVTT